jgi:hypothetical protein
MSELSEGTMSVATPRNATSRDCGTSVFECWRRRSNHERHGGKYQAVVRGDRCGVQESYRVFSRPRRAASDIAAETRGESAAEKAGADATATESAVATRPRRPLSLPLLPLMGRSARTFRSAVSSLFDRISKKFSVDWDWSGRCSTISGAAATTSRRHSWIGWTRPNLISTSD